jgi:subtilase-type serine protease
MNKHLKLASAALAWVALLSGCAGGGGGSGSTATSGPASLVYSGTSRAYSQAQVDTLSAEQEFKNLSQYGEVLLFAGAPPFSSVHPLELTNVHKAYGYGLSGQGESIAIFDTGFNTNQQFLSGAAFAEMQSKYNAGELKIHGNLEASTSSHGNQVASIAAARRDGQGYDYYLNQTGQRYPAFVNNAYDLLNHGTMGVAYNARLHLFDVNNLNTFPLMAIAIRAAKQEGTIVQNNSWGLTSETNLDRPFNLAKVLALPSSLPASLADNNLNSTGTWLALYTGFSQDSWVNYLRALKDYQTTGVVVFALQNDTSSSQPSLMAALPEVYPDLKPAWLAVGNIDTLGGASALSIRRESAACGATASYCLVADGTEVTGAGLNSVGGSAPGYSYGQSGTSFAAPQVSGMVALLAEAFPSLTPEDLVNRLLATANNSFFTPTAERVFSKEIRHGYNEEFGHGIPDLYAALQPITSGSRPLGFVLNGSPAQGDLQPLAQSQLVASKSLSRALLKGLGGSSAFSYDALGAGFQVSLAPLVRSASAPRPVNQWISQAPQKTIQRVELQHGYLAGSGPISFASQSSLAELAFNTIPVNKTWETPGLGYGLISSATEFATSIPLGPGQVIGYIGKSQPRGLKSEAANPNTFGTAFRFSLTSDPTSQMDLLVGAQRESEALRGTTGEGALAIAQHSSSFFIAPSYRREGDDWSLSVGASLGLSRAQTPTDSLIQSVSPIWSSEFYAVMARNDLFKQGDRAYLKLWQPETIESGELTMQLPNLVGPTTNVTMQRQTFGLSSQSRPWHLGLGYETQVRQGLELRQELMVIPKLEPSDGSGHSLGFALQLRQSF